MPQVTEEAGQIWVRVELGARSYDVIVGDGLMEHAGAWIAEVVRSPTRCAVITDTNVGPLYAKALCASLESVQLKPEIITVKAGEPSKSMTVVEEVCCQMISAGLDRSSFVVALGGGVVGDLAGFCAAIFNRGIPYVQIPTTVLSQVDSSVGGKTGVNVPLGKNLLGAFHQPKLVLADVGTLRSLPDREYREGFAEVIKHAAIRDAEMVPLIAKQGDSREGLAPLIARNIAIKAAVVEEDERETSGVRALLNFGHTVGHAVEAAAGYGELLHGEAISLGILAALRLSEAHCGLSSEDAARVEALLKQFHLPQKLPASFADTDTILDLMKTDKKFVAGKIRYVLLGKLGEAMVSREVTLEDIRGQIERLFS